MTAALARQRLIFVPAWGIQLGWVFAGRGCGTAYFRPRVGNSTIRALTSISLFQAYFRPRVGNSTQALVTLYTRKGGLFSSPRGEFNVSEDIACIGYACLFSSPRGEFNLRVQGSVENR